MFPLARAEGCSQQVRERCVVQRAPTADGDGCPMLRFPRGCQASTHVPCSNNEVGSLQPVTEVAAAARQRGVLVHCDAAQVRCAESGLSRVEKEGGAHVGHINQAAAGQGDPPARFLRTCCTTPKLLQCHTSPAAPLHLQSIGKVPVDVRQLGVDMLTIVSASRSWMCGACKVLASLPVRLQLACIQVACR